MAGNVVRKFDYRISKLRNFRKKKACRSPGIVGKRKCGRTLRNCSVRKLARKGKTLEKLERKQRRIWTGNGPYEEQIMEKNKNELYFCTVS